MEIAGRYTIYDKLGQGGAGTVYRVRDRVREDEVALKLLTGEAGDIAVEFTVLARLNHPGHPRIPEVYGYFVEGSDQYLVLVQSSSVTTSAPWLSIDLMNSGLVSPPPEPA